MAPRVPAFGESVHEDDERSAPGTSDAHMESAFQSEIFEVPGIGHVATSYTSPVIFTGEAIQEGEAIRSGRGYCGRRRAAALLATRPFCCSLDEKIRRLLLLSLASQAVPGRRCS